MKTINNIDIYYSKKNIDYLEALNMMEKRVIAINTQDKKELIWFLNHNHTYTIGTSGSKKEIRSKVEYPVIKTNRGGKMTYHGPGQRVVYFLIDLKKRKKDIRKFVSVIENAVIKVLKEFKIEARSYPNKIGIWIIKNKKKKLKKEEKIGAIGLRIKKWITYHGLSFNINPDLSYYDNIYACGLKGYATTSLKSLGVNITNKGFDQLFLNYFLNELKKL